MATAHVSGGAAVLLSAYPDAAPDVVRDALQETAQDLGPAGLDSSYGHGLVQIHDAFTYDLQRPLWPEGVALAVDRYEETSLTLSWAAATDNVGVTLYEFGQVGTPGLIQNGRRATVTGLQPGTSYVFEVRAGDKAGNLSKPLTATVHTPPGVHRHLRPHLLQRHPWMSGTNLTRGCIPPANDRFCPDDLVTRGQVAAF